VSARVLLRQGPEEGILRLTLNRPEKRNALNGRLVRDLREALDASRGDPAVRVVVLRGAGPDFCSGADLDELRGIADLGPAASLDDASRMGDLFLAMREHPTPIIAAVHGRALAGGCGIATACDMILAHEGARFGFPEVHLGFVPAMVMSLLRRKVPESTAFELVTLGRSIEADEAHRIGLVNRVVPGERFEAELEALSRELSDRSPEAIRLTKRLLYGIEGAGVADGIRRGAEVNALARLSDDCRDRVQRFLDRPDGG
jgi:methylglutaconyl-CoA hydratase